MKGTFSSLATAAIAIDEVEVAVPISTSTLSSSISLRASRVAAEGSEPSSSWISVTGSPPIVAHIFLRRRDAVAVGHADRRGGAAQRGDEADLVIGQRGRETSRRQEGARRARDPQSAQFRHDGDSLDLPANAPSERISLKLKERGDRVNRPARRVADLSSACGIYIEARRVSPVIAAKAAIHLSAARPYDAGITLSRE